MDIVGNTVYGSNRSDQRVDLWNDFLRVRLENLEPWALGGDFNIVWFSDERKGGVPECMRHGTFQ